MDYAIDRHAEDVQRLCKSLEDGDADIKQIHIDEDIIVVLAVKGYFGLRRYVLAFDFSNQQVTLFIAEIELFRERL